MPVTVLCSRCLVKCLTASFCGTIKAASDNTENNTRYWYNVFLQVLGVTSTDCCLLNSTKNTEGGN